MNWAIDYEADANERIMAALREGGCAFADKLEPAARLAGAQLETLKPVAAGATGNGRIYAGPVAYARRGSIVVVLATQNKVLTCHLFDEPGRTAAIERYMNRAEELPAESRQESTLSWMRGLVEEAGGAPGGETNLSDPNELAALIGCLFAGKEARERFYELDAIAAEGKVCPVAVGLIGPPSSGKPGAFCVAWPVTFALAPYIAAAFP